MDIIERAKRLESKEEAYILLLDIAKRLYELKMEKSSIETELAFIKASIFFAEPKLSSEKIEYTAYQDKRYLELLQRRAEIKSEKKLLENIYDIVSKNFFSFFSI